MPGLDATGRLGQVLRGVPRGREREREDFGLENVTGLERAGDAVVVFTKCVKAEADVIATPPVDVEGRCYPVRALREGRAEGLKEVLYGAGHQHAMNARLKGAASIVHEDRPNGAGARPIADEYVAGRLLEGREDGSPH